MMVFEKITECLTNERLDKIVKQSTKYRKIIISSAKKREELTSMLTEEQKNVFNDFLEEENAVAIFYQRFAYQQGMKDLMEFFISLLGEK